jgi:hypothetical protein
MDKLINKSNLCLDCRKNKEIQYFVDLIKNYNTQGFSGSFLVALKFFKKPPQILRGGKFKDLLVDFLRIKFQKFLNMGF